jgi:hypothetical protein
VVGNEKVEDAGMNSDFFWAEPSEHWVSPAPHAAYLIFAAQYLLVLRTGVYLSMPPG